MRKKNINIGIARAGNVIGGGDWAENRIVPDCIKSWTKLKPAKIRNPESTRPWQHVLEPLSGYLLLAEKLNSNKLNKIPQNWNFGPNISNCKSVKYIANYFAKSLKLKIKIAKNNSEDFKPETSYLRLSNFKARKILKWHPRWSLVKSLNKILEWNNNSKFKDYKKMCEEQIKNYLN